MKTLMITVTHKLFDDSKLPDGYRVVYVGEDNSYKDGWILANEGDNIADKHPWYSELAGQYYAWKNLIDDSVDYVGLCHYRRFFMSYKLSSYSIWDDIVTVPEIEAILSKHKIIIPFFTSKSPGRFLFLRGLDDKEQDQNMIIIRDIIHTDFPDYIDSFDKIIYGMNQVWRNMFIARKEIFESYCSWLFSLLQKYDDYISDHGYKHLPRIDALLAEFLILIWIDHNIEKKDIFNLDLVNVEETYLSYSGKDLKWRLLQKMYCRRSLLVTKHVVFKFKWILMLKMKLLFKRQEILDFMRRANDSLL